MSENKCKLQLVEPHNHRVNSAEHAIQTFKDAFIAAPTSTNFNFPIQLWDKLMPQVLNCLNLLCRSQIKPAISSYKAMNRPYDWNQYPLAPLGCKAVVYKDGYTRGSWASRGIDGWYLGPSMDHYRCDLYFIPETRAYQILGSMESFPQHCQLPNLTLHQHFRELTNELADSTAIASATPKGRWLIKLLQDNITFILNPPNILEEQRVNKQMINKEQTRVINGTPILTVPCMTDVPQIMQS